MQLYYSSRSNQTSCVQRIPHEYCTWVEPKQAYLLRHWSVYCMLNMLLTFSALYAAVSASRSAFFCATSFIFASSSHFCAGSSIPLSFFLPATMLCEARQIVIANFMIPLQYLIDHFLSFVFNQMDALWMVTVSVTLNIQLHVNTTAIRYWHHSILEFPKTCSVRSMVLMLSCLPKDCSTIGMTISH